mmetsp:Transcript_56683/g.175754  ORF Transcript_56683/g.175754 Transcript_56683/m.175754 type:complete len:239 (+) Transcript_56683:597-1313(+)
MGSLGTTSSWRSRLGAGQPTAGGASGRAATPRPSWPTTGPWARGPCLAAAAGWPRAPARTRTGPTGCPRGTSCTAALAGHPPASMPLWRGRAPERYWSSAARGRSMPRSMASTSACFTTSTGVPRTRSRTARGTSSSASATPSGRLPARWKTPPGSTPSARTPTLVTPRAFHGLGSWRPLRTRPCASKLQRLTPPCESEGRTACWTPSSGSWGSCTSGLCTSSPRGACMTGCCGSGGP